MRRTALLVSVALVLVAVASVPIGGLAATGDGVAAQQTTTTATEAPPANESDEEPGNESEPAVAPGERLGGVVAVGQAEFESDVEARTFGLEVARAASQNGTAAVVAQQLNRTNGRVAALEERRAALEEARENGSMSEGAYRARLAAVAAELRGAQRLANETANASQDLPVDLLQANGINATAIQTLQQRASQLGGPAVAEIARSIAGPAVGNAPDRAGPGQRGPSAEAPTNRSQGPPTANGTMTERGPSETPDRPGNQTESATETQTETDTRTQGSGPQSGADSSGRP
jgi:predicted deacylase